MKIFLKLVCLILVISAAHCDQYCSSKSTGDKGLCLSPEVCESNIKIEDAHCETDRTCCVLKFFDSNCSDGKPSIFMLYEQVNATNNRIFCSGTLINSNYILTAAHCINQDSTLQRFAKIDGSDREFKISKHYSFPGYANNITHRLNDVALFRLEEEIDPSINAKTVCLPTKNLGSSVETFTIFGYDRESKSIKEATTNLYDSDDCENFLTKYNFGHTISFLDSFCYNDSSNFVSGTPILVKDDNKYYQYGISTLGTLRREKDQSTPAISPILSIYQGWILKTLASS